MALVATVLGNMCIYYWELRLAIVTLCIMNIFYRKQVSHVLVFSNMHIDQEKTHGLNVIAICNIRTYIRQQTQFWSRSTL